MSDPRRGRGYAWPDCGASYASVSNSNTTSLAGGVSERWMVYSQANPVTSVLERSMIILPESDEELLRECEVETFRSSGPGGQHVNKTESAVRLRHSPSGVVITSQQERSQHRNKALCLEKLRAKIAQLNHRPAKRIPTGVPRSAKRLTLEAKARRAQIKRLRSKPGLDD